MKTTYLTIFAAALLPLATYAEEPELTLAVVSDVHMRPDDSSHLFENRFRKALRFFDKMKSDAVIGCGDWIEFGWHEWFRKVGEYWFETFPNNRRSDGRPIEKLFIFGDHEIENLWNPGITRRFSKEYILERDIPTYGRAKIYEETLYEPWAPIMRKQVNGYDFILAHFTMRENDLGQICEEGRNARWGESIPHFDEFFATNRFDTAKPFFCIMHKPPSGTVISPFVSTSYDDSPTKVLAQYPNCIVLCGHKHRSAISERNLWQGNFTCIEVPALQANATDPGHENGWCSCDRTVGPRHHQMPSLTADMRQDGGECYLMRVYSNRVVVERWNIVLEEKIADDWVISLPNTGQASFEARKARAKPVAFAEKARVTVTKRIGTDRDGNTNGQYVVTFPRAFSDALHSRGYDYLVTAKLTAHYWTRTACEKWVYSSKYYLPEPHDTNYVECVFSESEIPSPFQEIAFKITPYNAFGTAGNPLESAAIPYRQFSQ
ncbi:MAG: metallophosphoesterase [Kiritimatiellae bacterium]|nr:metallophosphoesterase [Kiritimatiellia bacterium]